MLGDGHRKEVSLPCGVIQGPHMHDLEELEFVHKLLEREGPALADGLEVLCLLNFYVKRLKLPKRDSILLADVTLNQGVYNPGLRVASHYLIVKQLLEDEVDAMVER
jgi:hypothetical protein